ncbi:protein kinase family protein [Blastococcus sp. TBT05-19]|uniref:protein kinase family protein n=1 Tax=Blastococcus sp. TBT05-19 TaxID=2250581 RepID=UPI0018F3E237|nr:protein kinase family protein [Blastococcus sp. TBT05-19]
MASTTTGLPDRYRPIDQIGPDETTPTGVIQCWRAKDRVLNRDVAVRVHTPAGPAAHAWITRALTAGGLATPALAMVYDASEGRAGDDASPGGAAYVVNEWIDGETLADRLRSGPMPEREVRLVLRRLAEGVAEAHRAGLAVGGLSLDNVVLRPNGLVGLRAVPAAAGSFDGDVTALGELLEACLTGTGPAAQPLSGPSDLVALARRARSSEPGQGLSSVAAMAALLAERPRGGAAQPSGGRSDDGDGKRRRLRKTEPDTEAPVRLEPGALPPVPPVPAVRPVTSGAPLPPGALGGDTVDASAIEVPERDDESFGMLPDDDRASGRDDDYDEEDGAGRHRLLVVGLPLLALAVVIGLAFWFGSSVLSVTGSVDDVEGSLPSSSAPADGSAAPEEPTAGPTAAISSAAVFDPFGDGEPENDDDVPLTFDGDPATSWSTLAYRGSPAFGNLKPGVGILYDLGSSQSLSGVTIASPVPGATVEVRTGESEGQALEDFEVATDGTLENSTELTFEEPVTARYVLVWVTGLVDDADGFSAQIGEVEVSTAG